MTGALVDRRCVSCTLGYAAHSPAGLARAGVRFHSFDPGERRGGAWFEPHPRRRLWSDERRRLYRDRQAARR